MCVSDPTTNDRTEVEALRAINKAQRPIAMTAKDTVPLSKDGVSEVRHVFSLSNYLIRSHGMQMSRRKHMLAGEDHLCGVQIVATKALLGSPWP